MHYRMDSDAYILFMFSILQILECRNHLQPFLKLVRKFSHYCPSGCKILGNKAFEDPFPILRSQWVNAGVPFLPEFILLISIYFKKYISLVFKLLHKVIPIMFSSLECLPLNSEFHRKAVLLNSRWTPPMSSSISLQI